MPHEGHSRPLEDRLGGDHLVVATWLWVLAVGMHPPVNWGWENEMMALDVVGFWRIRNTFRGSMPL